MEELKQFKIKFETVYSVKAEDEDKAIEKAFVDLEYDLVGRVDLTDIFKGEIIK